MKIYLVTRVFASYAGDMQISFVFNGFPKTTRNVIESVGVTTFRCIYDFLDSITICNNHAGTWNKADRFSFSSVVSHCVIKWSYVIKRKSHTMTS